MDDLISRQAAIDAVHKSILDFFDICDDDEESPMTYKDKRLLEVNKAITTQIKAMPSAEPDFSCDGCQTPRHICGICMRNYPNISDHYCTGEAWKEVKDETAV